MRYRIHVYLWPRLHPFGVICNLFASFFAFPLASQPPVEQKWAFEEEQKYKVGKFVLEEVKIVKYHWETD